MKKIAFTFIIAIGTIVVAFGQGTEQEINPGWLSDLDSYAKVFGLVLTGLGTLFGLPLAILNFRKTRAEIRKLELEANALEKNSPSENQSEEGYRISIADSNHVNIKILADPRFLGPLLLLLDFIIAWIIITLSSYLLGLIVFGMIKRLIVLIIAGILLVPIYRETVRVKKLLKPKKESETEDKKTSNSSK